MTPTLLGHFIVCFTFANKHRRALLLLLVGISLWAWFAWRFVCMLHVNVSGGSIGPCSPRSVCRRWPQIHSFLLDVGLDWFGKSVKFGLVHFAGSRTWLPSWSKRPCAALKKPTVRDDLSVRWTRRHEGAPWSNAEIIAELKEWAEQPEQQDLQQLSDVWDGHGESKKKPTRWGRCDKCNRAFAPHVYKSGPRAGRLVLLCNGFWSWNKAGDKRQCFRDQEVPRILRHFLPDYLLKQKKSVEAALKRGAVFWSWNSAFVLF